MLRPRTRSVPALIATAGAALALSPVPAVAQELYFAAGSSLYSTDAYCLDPEAAITDGQVGFVSGGFGISASYDDGAWPWPDPPGSGGGGGNQQILAAPAVGHVPVARQVQAPQRYVTHGWAVRLVGELYPLHLLPGLQEVSGELGRYVRPFVGVGAQISTDGDTSTERELPTYAVRGSTDPLVVYGASLTVPLRGEAVGLHLQFRGTSMFSGGAELEGPEGDVLSTPSKTLTWGTWLVGLSFGL